MDCRYRSTISLVSAVTGREGVDRDQPIVPRGSMVGVVHVVLPESAEAVAELHRLGVQLNPEHLRICASDAWRELLTEVLVPWTLDGLTLGGDVLEVGPGPGITTDLLRTRVERLTALELDRDLARSLSGRLSGSNVTVVQGDGRHLPFQTGRFSAVALFTMLHHVPRAGQMKLLREARRVLRPGGLIVGTDGIDTLSRRELHIDDDYYPVAPADLAHHLEAAGFVNVVLEERDDRFRFASRSPALQYLGLAPHVEL